MNKDQHCLVNVTGPLIERYYETHGYDRAFFPETLLKFSTNRFYNEPLTI